ncbi:MAG: RHS repeat-associated core domain-containing protein, partial [Planctomycetaceae bacterium]|nr:RHS repeat-associated core domain-containing protein [Planctomycetaceae bacterium]
ARIKYGHDHASNRTWREDVIAENNTVDLDELYTYDGLNRLATVERGEINGTYTAISSDTFGQTWDLDQLNNWDNFTEDSDGDATDELDQDRTHNDVNEITAITATTGANWIDPTYDAAGNTITGPTPGDETATQKYTYDAWNRMTKVTDGSDTTIAIYAYDGRNYRITKAIYSSGTLSHTDHFYYNENWQALEVRRETSGTEDPDPREQYVWHPDYIDFLAVRYYDADTDGNLAENSDGAQYYTQGANYHVLAITDDTGSVLERYHYDPYGRSTVLDADFTADADGVSDIDNAYTFTGRRLDDESGLHYFRNRYYDMVSGRFTSRDPFDYLDGDNLYVAYFVPQRLDATGKGIGIGVGGGIAIGGAWAWKNCSPCYTNLLPNEKKDLDTLLDKMAAKIDDANITAALLNCKVRIWGLACPGSTPDGDDNTSTTYDPGWAWRRRIFLAPNFFSPNFPQGDCHRMHTLMKECYRRFALGDFDDTGMSDNRADADFKPYQDALGCSGHVGGVD